VSTAVVTVVHGRHDHLRRQHTSLAAGSRVPDHVVVVAMGDAEVAGVVAAGPLADRCTVVDLPAGDRLPLARARNTGAATAFSLGGTLAVFLDVDCLAGPGLVEGYRAGWRSTSTYEGPRLLSGTVAYLDPAGPAGYTAADLAAARPHPARPAPAPGSVERATDPRLFWSLSFAVDAPSWAAIGGFDEAYDGYGGEDTDLGQRAATAGAAMWWVGGAPAFHQWHPVSDPPVEHVEDIVRNANLFHDRWGWFPMEGWLAGFAERGLAALDPDRGVWVTGARG
jgi:GT2 family glycosyltransferase